MRPILFGLFVFMLSATALNGQAAILALIFGDKVASENFNISLELGGGFTGFTNKPDGLKRKVAIQFGIGSNIKLSDHFYLMPTAYFLSSREAKLGTISLFPGSSLDNTVTEANTELLINYIDVPIFFYYQFNNPKWRIGLAPQVAFRTNASLNYTLENEDVYKQIIKEEVNSIDFGLLYSVSYVVASGRKGKGLIFSLRYYQGMLDVFNPSLTVMNENSKSNYFGMVMSFPFLTDKLAEKYRKPENK